MSIGNAFEPVRTAAEWNSGSCDIMAVALHRMYGLPMMAEFEWGYENGKEVLGYLVHAWVRLPDGRMLDAAGPREMIEPTEGGDPNDSWVMGYRIAELSDDDPHLLDIREETDYVQAIVDMQAYAWIAENLAPVFSGMGIEPVKDAVPDPSFSISGLLTLTAR